VSEIFHLRSYHSIYDSEYWEERYGDPTFTRHVNVAKVCLNCGALHTSALSELFCNLQTIGLAALRLSDSPVLPLNITRYALELSKYLEKVQEVAKSAEITDVDFSKLSNAISDVQAAAHQLDADSVGVMEKLYELDTEKHKDKHDKKKKQRKLIGKLRSINKRKMGFERGFINKEGLPRRQWYKHLGVAPGENLGVSRVSASRGKL